MLLKKGRGVGKTRLSFCSPLTSQIYYGQYLMKVVITHESVLSAS